MRVEVESLDSDIVITVASFPAMSTGLRPQSNIAEERVQNYAAFCSCCKAFNFCTFAMYIRFRVAYLGTFSFGSCDSALGTHVSFFVYLRWWRIIAPCRATELEEVLQKEQSAGLALQELLDSQQQTAATMQENLETSLAQANDRTKVCFLRCMLCVGFFLCFR